MRRIAFATALAALALTPASHGAPVADGGPVADAGRYEQLSNETTRTRWAYTNLDIAIRARPSRTARRVGKLRFNTEDGPPEVYLALRRYVSPRGAEWVQIRIPGRPNGRKGWVPREGLGEFHLVRTHLTIDRRTLKATLRRSGKTIFTTRVGVGKASTPTPAGRFWIRERLSGFGNPVYGPVAFGTSAYSSKLTDWPGGGVVGIHGTNQPGLIPGRPSHGCVRMRNAAILRLKKLMPVGTPVRIL